LHGIPLSVKDFFAMKGHFTSIGAAFRLKTIEEKTAVVITTLEEAGAIPIVRGNVPQAGLSIHA